MSDHTHLRAYDLHLVDGDTCVHRLLPAAVTSQCPRPPEFDVTGWPACGTHLAPVIRGEHDRGNPDVVVRRRL